MMSEDAGFRGTLQAPSVIPLDLAFVTDPALLAIGEKISTGIRLDRADAVTLFESPDLIGLGSMADQVNRFKNGTQVTFAANQHINPTNVCYLRTSCTFCSFARLPKEDGAYHYTLDQVYEEAAEASNGITREFHIVGGLDMKAGFQYYADMFRGLKARHPNVHIKALTAVEIAHIARVDKMSIEDVLIGLRDAGLDTMPGGGAEVFGKGVRMEIAQKKLAGEEWINVHRTAHRLGIRTNCTMLYGHVETTDDRVEHLAMLRDLQDEYGGFLAYIPLAYHPDHNELGKELGREGTATTGFDDLRNLAVGRLYLDNFQHIKSHWIMVTTGLSQTALSFGVNDLEGTVVREKIYHEAGAHTAQAMSLAEIVRLIRGAGRVPIERDSYYNVLRDTFDDVSDTAQPPVKVEIPQSSLVPLTRKSDNGSSIPTSSDTPLRVGRIVYVNCYPVYGAIDRAIVPLDATIVNGVPTELNSKMAHGELDISVVSAVEYAKDADKYLLLPDLAISCDGPVRSVMLFSNKPAEELDGGSVLVSRSSMTSVALLELLFENVWNASPEFVPGDAELTDIGAFGDTHDARLVIGDAALVLNAGQEHGGVPKYPYVYDLGQVWKEWTGHPFVFAVWVAQRTVKPADALRVHAQLIESRNWGVANTDKLARQAYQNTGVSIEVCNEYLAGLDYGLSYSHLTGLSEFFRRLVERGRVPDGDFSFLTAA